MRRPMLVTGTVVAGLLAFAACGGGSDGSTKASSTSAPAESTTRGAPAEGAFVDIQTCDNDGGDGTATGAIDNGGTAATAYTITIGFYDGDTLVGEGKSTTSTIPVGGSVDWTVRASDVGSGEVECHTVAVTTAKRSADRAGAEPATSSEGFPCDLVDQADIGGILGNPVEPGDVQTNHVTEDAVSFTAQECAWSASPGGDDEARLQVSRAEDNDGTDPGCPPLPGTSDPVAGLGTSAAWSWTDPGTASTVGTLRVCSAAALVDVTTTGTLSGDAQLAAARAIAEAALAAL